MGFFPDDEIKRKSFHLLMLVYILAYWVLPRELVLWGMVAAILVVVAGEVVRLRVPVFNQWILGALGGVHREEETNQFSGLPWTLSGAFFTMLFFPNRNVVLVSFLYLAFGDAVAALVGKRFGKHKLIGEKTIEGSLACLLTCFLIGLLFLNWQVALVGALLATAIEIIPWPLSDNFCMPLISAALLTLLVPIIP
jgi:dolichol kinase